MRFGGASLYFLLLELRVGRHVEAEQKDCPIVIPQAALPSIFSAREGDHLEVYPTGPA